MTIPAFILGCVLALLYGAVYHLIRGGGFGRIILYLVVSGASFWFGHLVANITGMTFLSLGPIHTGLATLFSIAGLIASEWLSALETQQKG